MKHPPAKPVLWIVSIAILALLALPAALLLPAPVHAAETTPPACSGDTYTVRPGDTWSNVSRRTGVTVAALKQLNPNSVRTNGWLWIGDVLCITGSREAAGHWYQVQPGDTWNTVTRNTGVPVRELWRANPALVDRLYWLYIGQRVWVPDAAAAAPIAAMGPAPLPAADATPTTAPAAETDTRSVTAVEATPTTAPVVEATPTTAPVVEAAPTPTAAVPVPTIKAGCAADLAGYPDLILTYLNKPGNKPAGRPVGLKEWLAGCGAITADPDAVATAAIQSATDIAVIVALHDPALQPPDGSGLLLVYHDGSGGYKLVHQAASAGSAALLTVADLNADKQPDIAWVDTTCDADTCSTALHVDSWDGSTYADWIEGEPAMASAEFKFADVKPEGSGQEIVLYGGLSAAADAGPQRARTETYASVDGAPYALFSQVFDPSTCLYHKILDADAAFESWATDGFDAVVTAYKAAIDDKTVTACGDIADELATLRDFARFRLSIAQYGAGNRSQAQATLAQIATPALRDAAKAFTDAYKSSGSIIQACREVGLYAKAHPAAWQFMADWGSGNPSFTAEELCPLK